MPSWMVIFKKKSTWSLPPGVSHNLGEVCRLKKTLYNLKQAPHAQFATFFDLTSLGLYPNHHDPILILKCTIPCHITFSLYIDDMIIVGDDVDEMIVLKSDLAFLF